MQHRVWFVMIISRLSYVYCEKINIYKNIIISYYTIGLYKIIKRQHVKVLSVQYGILYNEIKLN